MTELRSILGCPNASLRIRRCGTGETKNRIPANRNWAAVHNRQLRVSGRLVTQMSALTIKRSAISGKRICMRFTRLRSLQSKVYRIGVARLPPHSGSSFAPCRNTCSSQFLQQRTAKILRFLASPPWWNANMMLKRDAGDSESSIFRLPILLNGVRLAVFSNRAAGSAKLS